MRRGASVFTAGTRLPQIRLKPDELKIDGIDISALKFRVGGTINMTPGDSVHRHFMSRMRLGTVVELRSRRHRRCEELEAPRRHGRRGDDRAVRDRPARHGRHRMTREARTRESLHTSAQESRKNGRPAQRVSLLIDGGLPAGDAEVVDGRRNGAVRVDGHVERLVDEVVVAGALTDDLEVVQVGLLESDMRRELRQRLAGSVVRGPGGDGQPPRPLSVTMTGGGGVTFFALDNPQGITGTGSTSSTTSPLPPLAQGTNTKRSIGKIWLVVVVVALPAADPTRPSPSADTSATRVIP